MASISKVSTTVVVNGEKTISGYPENPLYEKLGGQLTNYNGIPPQSRPLLLHKIFELQVEKTPTHAALQWEDDVVLTYDKLNKASNQLARYLVSYFADFSRS